MFDYDRFESVRAARGVTKAHIAAAIGRTPTICQDWKKGKSVPSSDQLKIVAAILGTTPEYLSGESDQKEKPAAQSDGLSERGYHVGALYDAADDRARQIVDLTLAPFEGESQKRTPKSELSGKVVAFPKKKTRKDGFVEFKVYDQPAAAGLGNYIDEPSYTMEQYPAEIVPDGAEFGIRISGDSMEPDYPNGCTVFVKPTPAVSPGDIGIFVYDGKSYCKKLIADYAERKVKLRSLNQKYEDIAVDESWMQTIGRVLGHYGG